MTIGTRLFTWLRGELVGSDQFGNRYFREKDQVRGKRGSVYSARERRWVLYKGASEASTVPAEWHGWLHHSTDSVPTEGMRRYAWEKEHVPNLSGTPGAYHPPGSILLGGHRQAASGDYEPWQPE
jgi:NADH:ubiquinone oxidoreductase subunit